LKIETLFLESLLFKQLRAFLKKLKVCGLPALKGFGALVGAKLKDLFGFETLTSQFGALEFN
jgi:hypothetical protein